MRRARRAARPRAASGADRDVEPDEQRHAEADEHEVERGDVVGVAQRHAGRVRREQADDDRGRRHDRAGHERRAGRAGPRRAARPGGRGGLATGLEQRARSHRQAAVGLGAGSGCRAVRRSIPVRPRASASAVTAMSQAGEVVEDVVPAEVEGRGGGEGEQGPHADLHRAREPEQMRRQRRGEEDRDVQRGERADALRAAARRVVQELDALVEQDLLEVAHAGGRQLGEVARVGVDRPERRQQEVAPGGERPVDRERGRQEEAAPQVGQDDERDRDRDRDEHEEQLVDGRQRVGGDPAAEHAVQQRGGVAAREQAAVEVAEAAVEQLVSSGTTLLRLR